MTVEELTVEDAKLGYNIIKKPEPLVKLLPCVCGCNQRSKWYSNKLVWYKCNKCGFVSSGAYTERDTRIKWNEAVEKASVEVNVNELETYCD